MLECLGSVLALAMIAQAQEQPRSAEPDPPREDASVQPAPQALPEASSDQRAELELDRAKAWELYVMPYAWAPNVDGTVAARPLNVPIHLDPIELLTDADSVLTFSIDVEFRTGAFSLFAGASFLNFDDSGRLADFDVLKVDADLEFDVTWIEVGAGWRVFETGWGTDHPNRKARGGPATTFGLDVLAGGRVTVLEMNLDLDPSIVLPPILGGDPIELADRFSDEADREWIDPFIGVRLDLDIADRFTLDLRGDIGGFGVGSQFAAQAMLTLGWQFPIGKAYGSVTAGYKMIYQDYRDGSFEWDMTVHGPFIGLALRF